MSLREPVSSTSVVWRTALEIFLAVVVCAALLVLACTATLGVVLSHS